MKVSLTLLIYFAILVQYILPCNRSSKENWDRRRQENVSFPGLIKFSCLVVTFMIREWAMKLMVMFSEKNTKDTSSKSLEVMTNKDSQWNRVSWLTAESDFSWLKVCCCKLFLYSLFSELLFLLNIYL